MSDNVAPSEAEQTDQVEQAEQTVAEKVAAEVLGKFHGEAITQMPRDLYIPPEALEVFLDAFEGPLDLLLYLIKKNNLDIIDIPIAQITKQYMEYVDVMKDFHLELAGEYLLMAAMLGEIKSRMLLPRPVEEDDEDDPRAELVRRLQEYERFKKVAEELREFPLLGRDTFRAVAEPPNLDIEKPKPDLAMQDLLIAFKEVMMRAEINQHHRVLGEPLSVRERMTLVLQRIQEQEFVLFESLFQPEEGRMGVVVTFIAILELLKGMAVEVVQAKPFAPIHLRAMTS